MSKSFKQVRFSSNEDKDETKTRNNLDEDGPRQPIDLSSLLKGTKSEMGKQPNSKKRKKKTQFQKLKSEKKKLVKELKKVEKDIKEDSERKSSAEYTPYENRQRLARSTSEIHTKVQQLDEKISVKGKLRREKIQKSYKIKIKTTTIQAGKQHNRLINMTSKLHDLKLNEEEIRDEIRQERSLSSLSTSTSRCHSNGSDMFRLSDQSPQKWIDISDHPTCIEEASLTTNGFESITSTPVELVRLDSALSLTSGLNLEEKQVKAEQFAKKYEFTRELRNLIHEHMISRSYNYSYTSIIPPYKHKKLQPKKTKQYYNRNIYEDKINVVDYSKKQYKLPGL